MTEDELKAQEAGKSSQRTASKKNQQADSGSQETFINTDLTEDYNSGRELIRQRVKAFGAGMKDERLCDRFHRNYTMIHLCKIALLKVCSTACLIMK